MRKLIVSEFLTLDGVMQAPGGAKEDTEGGFKHGGWQVPFFADEVFVKAMNESFANNGGMLLGRKTYEIFAGYWPHVTEGEDNELAGIMNSLPKYVASTTLDTVDWENSTLLEGDVPEAVAKLKQEDGKDIYVIGSGELAQTLMKHRLIDEYFLVVYPLTLGGGKKLFREDSPKQELELLESTPTTAGALILRYKTKG